MNKKFLHNPLYIWLAFFLASALFIFYPLIDIYTSSLFFEDGFYLRGSFYERLFYKSVPIMVSTTALGSIAIFTYNYYKKKNILGINKRVIIYLLLVLSLAPGLIVNSLLKEEWGRARPMDIVEFGSTKQFTPAFIISDQGGNSFSSGHGAAAFSVLGFALLARKRRQFWTTLALAYGVAVSFARIIGGGHFLSDSVTSFFIVYITTYALYGYLIENKK
ncbi:phosphatase PAP2 family protein [Sulfurimonas sp. SAG-AH-194-C20]|nr:phosphatase PAP2 family protein [Sulfurimonas sp. SAG-AH-194-C20]MDF1879348.1 phosphatase PAP2 family protein [Sulfurimonas sp. SAG-AH-194-C20]